MKIIKSIAARLPGTWQQELRKAKHAWQLRRDWFRSEEPEFSRLDQFVTGGDWVIDVGANIGHYTIRLANLVGPHGRVIAMEPITETFELLAANVRRCGLGNVTLLNLAASHQAGVAAMTVPRWESGLPNYYTARHSADGDRTALCLGVDMLDLSQRVTLVKIDAEGHELEVLQGMTGLLKTHQPTLIVELNSRDVAEFLKPLGYKMEQLAGSPNAIFRGGGFAAQRHDTTSQPQPSLI